jgi:NAD(P)-dependent dehydrogenase (short-subunit alcohol dehydrogenase family)
MSLKNKVAIVTGDNSGIGQAIVLELARQGVSIVIDYISHPEATEALEQQITALGGHSIVVEADVSRLADVQKLVDPAVDRFGRVDIVVNNASIETRTSVLDTTEDQYEKVMAINLKSAFFGTQIAAKQRIKQDDDRQASGGLTAAQKGARLSRLLPDSNDNGVSMPSTTPLSPGTEGSNPASSSSESCANLTSVSLGSHSAKR